MNNSTWHLANRIELALSLCEKWEKDAQQYKRQVDEATAKSIPCEQTIALVTALRGCARELRSILEP